MNLLEELKRRNVIRVGVAYVVIAWLLLQIVDFVLEVIAAPDWILQVFVLAAAVGLPIVLIFSWVFEMTPEGIKRESEIQHDDSITPHTGRKLDRVIIVTLALAVMVLLADKFLSTGLDTPPSANETAGQTASDSVDAAAQAAPPESAPPDEQSIAVLPFVNMSTDPRQEFFSDGISEEILNALTYIPDLKVAARSSSFQFKGQGQDIHEVGQKLDVALVLEGSVRTAGDRVRITAQLIQAADGFQLWSRTYDRELEDVFAIQDEIAQAIASELKATFTQTRTARTQIDLIAYQHYLKARAQIPLRTEASLRQAIAELELALETEPGYAPAMALMAEAYLVLPWYSMYLPVGEAREIARDWAQKALEKEPDNAEALATLGTILYQSDLDWTESRRLLERAVSLAPASASANNFLGDFFLRICDFENALIYESRALELDPLSPVQFTDLANVHALTGNLEKVTELSLQVRALDPAFFNMLNLEFNAYALAGDLQHAEEILDYARSQAALRPERIRPLQIKMHFELGQFERARDLFAQSMEALENGQVSASIVSFDAAWMGDFDTAAAVLQRAVDQRDGIWVFPLIVRLPEQAPGNAAWQTFWSQPRVAELAKIRRSHGFHPDPRQ